MPDNGQVQRMDRTIKGATVKRYHHDTHDQLCPPQASPRCLLKGSVGSYLGCAVQAIICSTVACRRSSTSR